jgi:tetratricopeptide (TPR) repeat protein
MLASGSDDLQRAAELAELALVEAGRDQASRAQALEIAAILDMNLGRSERAGTRSTDALRLYQQLGDAQGTARVLDAQAMATFLAGNIRDGGAALRRAADLFEDSGDLVRVVTPRSTSGHALVFGGRAADGLAATTDALDLARTLGHPEGQAYALWHRTEALAALGRPAEAMTDARAALAIATRLGHRGWTATSWRAVGIAAQTAGDLDEALRAFDESLAVSEHLDLFASWAAARAALVHLELGNPDLARPLVTRALATGPPLGHYEARLAQAELAVATDDPDAAAIACTALTLADDGGALQGRVRLTELAAAAEASGAGRCSLT